MRTKERNNENNGRTMREWTGTMREWGGTMIIKDRNNDEQIESTGRIMGGKPKL